MHLSPQSLQNRPVVVYTLWSVNVALFLFLRFSLVLYNPLHVFSQDGLLEIGPKVLFCMQDHIISTNRNIIIYTLYYFMLLRKSIHDLTTEKWV